MRAPERSALHHPRVLLVEDEPAQREVLAYNLEAEGFDVTQATLSRRLERLTEAGVIAPARAVIDWRKLGYEVEVSLRFTLDKTNPRAFDEFIAAALAATDAQQAVTLLNPVAERLTGWGLESKGFIEQMHAAAHTLYRLECRSQRRSCGNCGST